MPIEIRELNIRTTVNQQSATGNAQSNQSAQGGGGISEEEKEALINECVQRVISKIKSNQER